MYEDCPQAELELCWWYEYSREGCLGAPVQLPLFPDRGEEWAENKLYPEWPLKAYLAILAPQREKRLRQLKRGGPDYLRSLNLMPAFRTFILPEMAQKYLDGFRVFEFPDSEVRDYDTPEWRKLQTETIAEAIKGGTLPGLRHHWPIREISDACWEAFFCIDWRRSDSEIRADIAAWLKEHRPKAFPSPKGERGAGNYARRLQTDLKVLGAFRLLRHYKQWQNIPAEAAIYEDPSGWMRAHQKAKERLKFFQLWEPNG